MFTDNQIFKIAVLPAEYTNSDLSMDELMDNLQIETSDIEILHN